MICRYKLMEDGKFVRYARSHEAWRLRPNPNGKGVQMLNEEYCAYRGLEAIYGDENGDEGLEPGYGRIPPRMWIDVSDKYEVEWGDVFSGVEIYVNDITKSEQGHIITAPTMEVLYIGMHNYLEYYPETPRLTVIGNIHMTPELLEEK